MNANPNENSNVPINDVISNLEERIHLIEQAVTTIGKDSVASKSVRGKTKQRAVVMYGITPALVVDTIDPWKENRVRFFHPLIHEPNTLLTSLPYANPVSPMGGFDDCGLNWVPPAGSTVMIMFRGGLMKCPFYLGTIWHRNRGKNGSFPFPIQEWQIYQGHRKGYFHGPGSDPNDESQVLPPWNTENYNDLDLDQNNNFNDNVDARKRITFPNIYGFKTPEKHMIKMVDGDAKCNRRWKRFEIMSSGGNWMLFKDDHLHYGGQWAHPNCPPDPENTQRESVNTCAEYGANPYFTDLIGKPIEKTTCNGCVQNNPLSSNVNNSPVFKHSSTPGDPPDPPHKYHKYQGGANIAFKHQNECRPYRGPGTPQNNRCDLPQSGIQFLSISGHTFVMDDSVEEPSGKPEWERSLKPFDFGCNDKYLGLLYMKSATGHALTMSDMEETSKVRGWRNFVELRSANGSFIQLNDETIKGQQSTQSCVGQCQTCPPDHAGPRRGVHIYSTSNHKIKLIDHMNLQCSPCRKEGGERKAKATKAYMQFQSGYGLELRFNDDFSQEETQSQWIQLLHPQCVGGTTDSNCNAGGDCASRGPHMLRFQGRPKGTPGMVFLRAGGYHMRQTYDADVVIVGDKQCNPADKYTYVSKRHICVSEDIDYRYSGESHILYAEDKIILAAGRDCPPINSNCKNPCLYSVIVSRFPVTCPLTKIIHWTQLSASERVFASALNECNSGLIPAYKQMGGKQDYNCGAYAAAMANAGGKGCSGQPQSPAQGQNPETPEATPEFALPTS